ncbi:MAG: aspartate--tRNA ligase [Bacteroidales bacterium]
MAQLLGDWARTHTCGDLRPSTVGERVTLLGWVQRVRDLGALVFVDVRDRYGITQVVFRDNPDLVAAAKRLHAEFVIGVNGTVQPRGADSVNPKLPTGGIEVVADELRVLNEAKTPPFEIKEDVAASDDLRLRYRYLDLRRPGLQANLALRHKVALATRKYFDSQDFLEIETPVLGKSTPEGARDYLVPSRVHPGEFYALPQSPQLFKQLLMISGMDRYFQIVKCFRDEDLRADRQPEFTQIDVEMSFATPERVFDLIEPLMQQIFALIGCDVVRPFPRLPYSEAMARYGSDKPDLRVGLEIVELGQVFQGSSFGLFADAAAAGKHVRGLVVPGGARYSRRELDELGEQAKQAGGGALIWARRASGGAVQSSALKAAGEETIARALESASAREGDLLLMTFGDGDAASTVLGQLRLAVARKEQLLKPDQFAFAWVVGFPLLEWDENEKRFVSVHHPFTSPVADDLDRLDSEPGRVRAQAYDLVLNGSEIGGGSIRIHDSDLQSRVFKAINLTEDEARHRFGFFLEALQYGTPPHGGIALGLDRIVTILAGETSIRDVMAFPKTAAAVDQMTGAPTTVDTRQLSELHISVRD